MAKKRASSRTPSVTAKDLSQKVETRSNSARLASVKPKQYKNTSATELPVKRTTLPKGTVITKKIVTAGKDKFTRYDTKRRRGV